MAFTTKEFIRGALAAWLCFNLVIAVLFYGYASLHEPSVLDSHPLWVLVVPIPWPLGALVIATPLTLALGFALRRITNRAIHLAAFALFGALIGTTVFTALTRLGLNLLNNDQVSLTVALGVITGISVAFGWRITAKRALHADEHSTADQP